jgi:hypothetical protein
MYPDTPSVTQISHVISQAAAPAFLLGALAAFIAVLITRLNRVIDRTIVLNAISDDDIARCRLKADLPRLMRRAAMLNRAIFWAVIGSIAVTLLVIVAFASAFFAIANERRGGHPVHRRPNCLHGIAGRFCAGGANCIERVRPPCLMPASSLLRSALGPKADFPGTTASGAKQPFVGVDKGRGPARVVVAFLPMLRALREREIASLLRN